MRTAAGVWTDCWARLLGVFGRQHSSRIGFIVAADTKSNVVVFYFLVWSQSRLLCCVGSAPNAAATLGDTFLRRVFLNRRAAARYRALASIISGRENFSF
jgi:hypothetical protein